MAISTLSRQVLTVAEAAEIAGVSKGTVWGWLGTGELSKIRPGGSGLSVRIRG